MQAKSSSPNQFRLASDAALARAPITACRWQSYISWVVAVIYDLNDLLAM